MIDIYGFVKVHFHVISSEARNLEVLRSLNELISFCGRNEGFAVHNDPVGGFANPSTFSYLKKLSMLRQLEPVGGIPFFREI